MTQADQQVLRQQIVEIGRNLWTKNWVASNDGNISCRLPGDRILCTPTGISKGMMTPADLIICDMAGNKVEGNRERTSEIMMHLTIYSMRPDVHAVVHAHPPVSTGFAASGRALNQAVLPEVIVNLGCIPLAAYGLPGTPALSEALKPYVPTFDAILMGNHGAVCYADDLWRAYFRLETVEHTARISLVAELLGGPNILPREEVDKLFDARTRYGIRSRAQAAPGCPVVAEDLSGSAPASCSACGCGSSAPGAVSAADGEEKFAFTRAELIALVNDALRAHGVLKN